LEELGALFNPGMRHEQERREKLELLREDEGNAADPPSTVDLDAGIAVLRLPKGAGPKVDRPPGGPAPTPPAAETPAVQPPAPPRIAAAPPGPDEDTA
jgi:hypothetical protein